MASRVYCTYTLTCILTETLKLCELGGANAGRSIAVHLYTCTAGGNSRGTTTNNLDAFTNIDRKSQQPNTFGNFPTSFLSFFFFLIDQRIVGGATTYIPVFWMNAAKAFATTSGPELDGKKENCAGLRLCAGLRSAYTELWEYGLYTEYYAPRRT